MISKLPKTWDKLHHKPQVTAVSNQPKETQTEQNLKSSASAEHSRYSTYHPDTISYTLNHDDKEHRFYIPEKCLNISTMSLTTEILRTVRNLPIWL